MISKPDYGEGTLKSNRIQYCISDNIIVKLPLQTFQASVLIYDYFQRALPFQT